MLLSTQAMLLCMVTMAFVLVVSLHCALHSTLLSHDAGQPASGPQWRDSGFSRPAATGPNIYFVEEHHYALHYWKTLIGPAVERNGGPLALLHWDAHPDMAFPEKGTREDDWYGMTSNDEFIRAAAVLDLIDRTVWIYPSWDSEGPRHRKQTHNKDNNTFVVTIFADGVNATGQQCGLHLETSGRSAAASMATWHETREQLLGVETMDENNQPCNISTVHMAFTISDRQFRQLMSEDLTALVSFLRGGSSVDVGAGGESARAPLLVDIDEDFFAQFRGRNLVERSFHHRADVYGKLERLLETLCPAPDVPLALFERPLSDSFRKVVRAARDYGITKDHGALKMAVDRAKSAIDLLPVHICTGEGEEPREDDEPDAEPRGEGGSARRPSDALGRFGEVLVEADLRSGTLDMLEIYGVCLQTGHLTRHADRKLKMCMDAGVGGNAASDTDVTQAVANLAEEPVAIQARTMEFERDFPEQYTALLQYFTVPVGTVCRSVRDGYTPRHQWHRIEGAVLRSVQKVGMRPVFTEDLLGGRNGWDNWTALAMDETVDLLFP